MMVLWLSAALAGDESWVGLLRSEIEKQRAGLTLPDAPELYHLRYRLQVLRSATAVASFGSPVARDESVDHTLGVEVRVGSPMFDNTGFGGWEDGMGAISLPIELDDLAIRRGVWRVTDMAYKQAVEHLARKEAQWQPPPDHAGDYSLTGAVVADDGHGEIPPSTAIQDLAVRLSGAFVGGTNVDVAEVHVGAEGGAEWVVDSEGTAVLRPLQEVSFRAVVSVVSPDGARVSDERLWTGRALTDLPAEEAMISEIVALQAEATAVGQAIPLSEEYVGPVVFEGDAAVALFRWLLIPQLEGTPPPVAFDSFFGDLGGSNGPSVRVGRRVLPEGWTARDDMTSFPNHPAWALHDAEGTPARPVSLVDNGIVRDLLMSRVPRPGLTSNGHARGYVGSVATGRASMLTVEGPNAKSTHGLYAVAAKAARTYGRDGFLVVRRLEEPAVVAMTDPDRAAEEKTLPNPLVVVWRDTSGNETPLRDMSFSATERFVLRDLLAAGPRRSASFMAPFSGDASGLGPTAGLATYLSAPDVVVGELEVVPVASDPGDGRIVPLPTPNGTTPQAGSTSANDNPSSESLVIAQSTISSTSQGARP